jgi:hypothetical protein
VGDAHGNERFGLNDTVAGQRSKIGALWGMAQGGIGPVSWMTSLWSHGYDELDDGDPSLPNQWSGPIGHGRQRREGKDGQGMAHPRVMQ